MRKLPSHNVTLLRNRLTSEGFSTEWPVSSHRILVIGRWPFIKDHTK